MGSDQKRLIVALVLSGLVIFAWQSFFAPKVEVSKQPPKQQSQTQRQAQGNQRQPTPTPTSTPSVTQEEEKEQDASQIETEEIVLNRDGHQFSFLNDLTIQNIRNPRAVFDFQSIAGEKLPFRIKLLTDAGAIPLKFKISSDENADVIRGIEPNHNIKIVAKILENGKLDFKLSSSQPYRYRFIFKSKPKELENGQFREFVYFSEDVSRIEVGEPESSEANLKWFGIDFNYHLFSFILKSSTPVLYESTNDGRFIIDFVRPKKSFIGDLVFTKKNYDTLVEMGNNLKLAVDFGFMSIIAVPILRSLQWFYSLVPNYGVAIILLTLVIRMLLFPLSYSSFRSMKKMQKLQPELNKLKEKYKDDPQKMQKETMELFKKTGANPLGGCLPLILQMPIFFAFYRVLYGAVELVNAPFMGWIQDLSVKDPYYVLPVVMALLMFGQQKLTPTTTMDPTQRKVMMFLPLVFGFIMKDLPAGLNLYIAVSTLFGIVQQLVVYKMPD